MEERNIRTEESSKLPLVTLGVLVAFICALLFIGYEYFSDGPTADIKNITEEQNAAAKEIADAEPVSKVDDTVEDKPKKEAAKAEEKAKENEKKNSKVAAIPDGGITIPHVVASGETFYGIASRYNLKTDVLQALNPDLDPTRMGIGSKLKVKIKAKHTIGPGDILSVVAKKYGISKEAIMAANKLEKDFAKRGDELIIPFGGK